MNRRQFVLASASLTAGALISCSSRSNHTVSAISAPAAATQPADLHWHDLAAYVQGRGWSDTASPYDRLPARAQKIVRPEVWKLSRDSAGLFVDFESDTDQIWARYTLLWPTIEMYHMAATSFSGLDLYGMYDGKLRWAGISRPTTQHVEGEIFKSHPASARKYRLYLPLYNGVTSLELGLPKNASFTPVDPKTISTKPILYYGTSIAQGACASRSGMMFTSMLNRRMNRTFINLGFSGQGKMDLALAPLFAEVDAAVIVIDCLPNMNLELTKKRPVPFIQAIRKTRPTTPILLVEDRTLGSAPFDEPARKSHAQRRAELKQAHDQLKAAGDKHLAYLPGDMLLGSDGEALADGSHPNDVGMVRYADALEPALRSLLA